MHLSNEDSSRVGRNRHDRPRVRLLIVQPYLTAYRLPVFAEIAEHFDEVLLASSPAPDKSGYGQPSIKGMAICEHILLPELRLLGGRLLWQRGLLKLLLTRHPTKLLIAANPRALSFWIALLVCRWQGIACYSYGQGFFNKPNPPRWLIAAYRILVACSNCYICYTASGLESLRREGIRDTLAVAENSLRLDSGMAPTEKKGTELGVLYLGRLRKGCNLDLLIEAQAAARAKTKVNLQLHVIGSGELACQLEARYAAMDWITWHGELYEQSQVKEIAKQCRVGCHPGHAGLSVVHFMGLSLVPVIHDQLDLHMGPEPSYVIDDDNGRRFVHADGLRSLTDILAALFTNHDCARLAASAFRSYQSLNEPSLAQRLIKIMQMH